MCDIKMEKVILSLMLILAGRWPEVLAHQAVAQLGGLVTLPCKDNNFKVIPADLLDIQWWTGEHLVTQFHLGRIIQGSMYRNRTALSTEGLRKGDFSLSITHTEYSDNGRYQCVLIKERQRVTLGEVELEVGEHVSRVTADSGSQIQLSLPDESALTLSFLPDGGNLTKYLCEVERHLLTCAGKYTNRIQLNNDALILTNITSADSGTFFMRDKRTSRSRRVVILQVSSAGTTLHSAFIVLIALAIIVYCLCAGCALVSKTCPVFQAFCQICELCFQICEACSRI